MENIQRSTPNIQHPTPDKQTEHNFKHHSPRGDAAVKHAAVRAKALELAALINDSLPPTAGRERALAVTKCEEAMMWACAGITRHSEG